MSTPTAALAQVIPLPTATWRPSTDECPTACQLDPTARRDVRLLRGRYGDRWSSLPPGEGRALLALERLLGEGPTATESSRPPAEVAAEAQAVAAAALTHGPVLADEVELLSEALGTDLAGVDLRHLDQVVGAVLDLGLVREGDPSWADPAAARAARLVLDAHGAAIREAALRHAELYEHFTERVWDLQEARLRLAQRPTRLVARLRVRSELTRVSRTAKLPGTTRALSTLVLEARAARARLADLAPLLASHLGSHARGPLTDVDATVTSVGAVLRLQAVLGERLDIARLHDLLLAEAFTSAELTTPALSLRSALRAWQGEVVRSCGGDPWALPAARLVPWAARVASLLPRLTGAITATAAAGRPATTMKDLVDDLLLRQRIDEVHSRETDRPARDARAGSVS